ncbi:MAG: sulfur carrier protein ThiS [Candidatus Methanoplasma sp.]|jgi:sulfur carrier protein|nr:sulfur carrier protein ThiS [Candidatus Methanoplasma sp.]
MMINGRELRLSGPRALSEILEGEGYSQDRVAVEMNGSVVPRRAYRETSVSDADRLEIVGFVGGG